MSQSPNSYDVARQAGVSRTVVSLVVNGKADRYGVAKATQEKVRAAIRRTGYVPNMFVRDLFLKRREAVAVGQADGGTPDLEKVSSVVRQPLAAAGYRFQVAVLPGHPADAERQITALLKAGAVVLVAPEPAVEPASEQASEPPRDEQRASESEPAGELAAAGTSASGQASPTSGTGVPVSSETGAGDGSATGAAPNNRWSPLLDRLRQQRRP
jgi:hypothetical protein